MPDAEFADPRLAALYDARDGDRRDLVPYLGLAHQLGARQVVDLGCGTGVFARLLAERGYEVVGVDPAAASLELARAGPGGERVRWILGDASALPALNADLVTMTGNTVQAVVDPAAFGTTLRCVRAALRPGGSFVFETRNPSARAWLGWNRATSWSATQVPGVGVVESWVELTALELPLVSFRWTFVFEADGAVLISDSTLRFRDRAEVEAALVSAGFVVDDVWDAPDRPGLELVVLAQRD